MNPETGHLIDTSSSDVLRMLQEQKALRLEDYESVPPHLQAEARKRLAGKAETWVSKRGSSPLARHAAERRKARRKAARMARRRNR